MTDKAKKKILLDKSSGLSSDLTVYFNKLGFEVLPSVVQGQEVDLILLGDQLESAKDQEDFHDVVSKEIPVLSLVPCKSIEEFIKFNGKAQINPDWMKHPIGEKILDGFFLEDKQSVHLEDTFGAMIENYQSFNVINHNRIGHYSDLLTASAFDGGYNLIGIRTFISNLVYYMFYLRQSGIGGVPLQVDYGAGESFFAVRVSASVSNFVLDYIWDCFKDRSPINPLNYILGDTVKICNYFETVYLEKAEKIVFTGVWVNDSYPSLFSMPSFSVSNILSVQQYQMRVEKILNDSTIETEELPREQAEKLNNKTLPGEGIKPAVQTQVAIGEDGSIREVDDEDSLVAGATHIDKTKQVISGDPEDITEEVQRVGGDPEDITEEAQRVPGGPQEKESIQRVGGNFDEEDNFSQKIAGSKEEKEKMQIISGSSEIDVKGAFNQIQSSSEKEKDPVVQKVQSSLSELKESDSFAQVVKGGDPAVQAALTKDLAKTVMKEFKVKDKEVMQKILASSKQGLDEVMKVAGSSPEKIDEAYAEMVQKITSQVEGTDEAKQVVSANSPSANPNATADEKMSFAMEQLKKAQKRSEETLSADEVENIQKLSGLDKEAIEKAQAAAADMEEQRKRILAAKKKLAEKVAALEAKNGKITADDLDNIANEVKAEGLTEKDASKVKESVVRALSKKEGSEQLPPEELEKVLESSINASIDEAKVVVGENGEVETEDTLTGILDKAKKPSPDVNEVPVPGNDLQPMERKILGDQIRSKDKKIAEMMAQLEEKEAEVLALKKVANIAQGGGPVELDENGEEVITVSGNDNPEFEGSGAFDFSDVTLSEDETGLAESMKEGEAVTQLQLESMKRMVEKSAAAIKKAEELQRIARASQQELAMTSVETSKVAALNNNLNAQIDHLKKSMGEQLESTKAEVKTWKERFQEVKSAQISEQRENGQGELEQAVARNKSLEAQLEIQKKKVDSVTELLKKKDSESRKDTTKREFEMLKVETHKLKAEHEGLKRKNEINQRKVTEANAKLAQLQEKAKVEIQKAIKQTEQKMSKDKGKVQELTDKLKETEDKAKEAYRKMKQLEIKLKQAAQLSQNKAANVTNEKKPKSGEVDTKTKRKIESLETQNKRFTEDLAKLNNDLTQAKQEHRKIQTEYTTMKNENDRLKAKIKVLQGKNAAKKAS